MPKLLVDDLVTTHVAEADPHTQYLKESDANWVDLTDSGATTLHKHDHGGMDGLADDDHTQYVLVNGTRAFTGSVTEDHETVSYTASGTTTLDASLGSYYSATAATGATTWSFSNLAASGNVTSFVLELTNGGSQTQTWPAATDWVGGTAPTLTAAGVDVLTFVTRDAGTKILGFVVGLDVK